MSKERNINVLIGYLSEQAFTTINFFGLAALFDIGEYIEKRTGKQVPLFGPSAEFDEDEYELRSRSCREQLERDHRQQFIGTAIGGLQDIACMAGSISYLAGNDSKLALIAAGITGVKLVTNCLAVPGFFLEYGIVHKILERDYN